MIDLTEAVDAAARARCAQGNPEADFDDLPAMTRHAFRELVAPIVTAAAPTTHAELRGAARPEALGVQAVTATRCPGCGIPPVMRARGDA